MLYRVLIRLNGDNANGPYSLPPADPTLTNIHSSNMSINHETAFGIIQKLTGHPAEQVLRSNFKVNDISKDIVESSHGSMRNRYHSRRRCAGWIHELFLLKLLQGINLAELNLVLSSAEQECDSGESITGWLAFPQRDKNITTSIYYIKGCFDMYEIGAVLLGEDGLIDSILERTIYSTSLNNSVSAHVDSLLSQLCCAPRLTGISKVTLTMNLPLWHNVGHVAWNGLNALYKYEHSGMITKLLQSGRYSLALLCKNRLDYFDANSLSTSLGCSFETMTEKEPQRCGRLEELLFPLDTMHIYGNIAGWLDKAWSAPSISSGEHLQACISPKPEYKIYILGIKGSSKQCPISLQVKFTCQLAKHLYRLNGGNCEIVIDGCWSPIGCTKSRILREFIRQEKEMFRTIASELHTACNYAPLTLIGLNSKEKHSLYKQASSASFFDGSCASQAVLEELPFQIVLYNEQPYALGSMRESGAQRWCTDDCLPTLKNFPQIVIYSDQGTLWDKAIASSAENLVTLATAYD